VDYQKSLNLRAGDGAAKVFTNELEDTEVPQLRLFVESFTVKFSKALKERPCPCKVGATLFGVMGDASSTTPTGDASSATSPGDPLQVQTH